MIGFLKKIWAWIVAIPKDKLLHDYASALIALYSFVLVLLVAPFWTSFGIANAITIAVFVGKEIYDYFHKETQSAEWLDIAYDAFGLLKIDIALLILGVALNYL